MRIHGLWRSAVGVIASAGMLFFLGQPVKLAHASDVMDEVYQIQAEWEQAFYKAPDGEKSARYRHLIARLQVLAAKYPYRPEPLIMEAIVLCTYAGAEWGLSSLTRLDQARELLERSLQMDPAAMEGSAYITLGNLYYRLPGWPISYGDDDKAEYALRKALVFFPDGLDSNYFFADFLMEDDRDEEALPYLLKAEAAPTRPHQVLSDAKLKEQVDAALRRYRSHEDSPGDFFSRFIPVLESSH